MQRMIILFAILGLVLPSVASAKLYKCKDAEGQVVYTDQPCEGEGEELKLPASVTYTPKPIPKTPTNNAEDSTLAEYKTLEIVTPENDKLITSLKGEVTFSYKITGPLLSLKGHKYGLELDGQKLKARGITNQVRLDNINPGSHTIRVFVVDKDDKELISSASTTFHMRRQVKTGSPTPGDIPPEAIPGASETDGNNPGQTTTFPGSVNTIPGGAGTIPGGRR